MQASAHTAKDSNPSPLALTIQNACARLGVGRSTLYELMKAGEIRHFKIGSRTLIPDSELRTFIEKRMQEAV